MSTDDAESSGDRLGYSGGLTTMGVSSWVDKFSTIPPGKIWGPTAVEGVLVTISVSEIERVDVTALMTSCDEVLVGGTKGVGAGEDVVRKGKGGNPETLVVWGVAGAEGTPVRAPPTAGTDDTGGS